MKLSNRQRTDYTISVQHIHLVDDFFGLRAGGAQLCLKIGT